METRGSYWGRNDTTDGGDDGSQKGEGGREERGEGAGRSQTKMEGKQMTIRQTAARRIKGCSECLPDYTATHQTISWPIQQAANQTSPATSHITNLTKHTTSCNWAIPVEG